MFIPNRLHFKLKHFHNVYILISEQTMGIYVLICFDCHFTIIRCHKMALKIGLFWAWHINRLMLLIFISLWIVFNRSQLKYLWSQTKRSHTKVNQINYSYRMRYALSYQYVVNEAYCLCALQFQIIKFACQKTYTYSNLTKICKLIASKNCDKSV